MTLDQYMSKQKLSDAALAEKVGVSQPTIWRIRNRKRRPSPEVAKKLEQVTGLSAADLIFADLVA